MIEPLAPGYNTLLIKGLCMHKYCDQPGSVIKNKLIPITLCDKHARELRKKEAARG